MKFLKWITAGLLIAFLTACGGGGGSPGTNVSVIPTTTTTTASPTAVASDLIIGFENGKNSLKNTGSDTVKLNVTTVNSTGNALPDVAVTVQVDNGGVFLGDTPPSADGSFKTNSSGVFSGTISSPGNRANRDINVVIISGNARRTAVISVTGSQITITPVPGAPLVSSATALNIKLVDANGAGIPNTNLTISGTAGFAGNVVTNNSGDAIFNGTSPALAGTSTITVSGSGVATTIPLTTVSPSGGGVPNAIGPIGPGSLSANPTNIANNVTVSSNNKSAVTFKVLNASNQGVPNVRVRFEIVAPGLGAGERMSTGNSVVYTDAAGEVSSDYIAGTRSSPTNGVNIRACYGLTDSDVAGSACTLSAPTSLTVAGQALNLSIFSNNTLQGLFNNTIYVKTLVVKVADSAGNPVRDAVISASLDITHYQKGRAWNAGVFAPSNGIPTIADTYTNTLSPVLAPTSAYSGTTTVGFNVWCMNEDLSRNGTRDAGEDLDGDGVLEPRASDITISTPNGNRTDANGNMLLDVQWGQNVGRWLAYTVRATTNVAGSEGTNSSSFITDVLQSDVSNGAFLTPPYGINRCNLNN
jgi:hypothetical protein